ncbi:hypothetical protein ACQ4PT_049174 [Festuca glaucescens]
METEGEPICRRCRSLPVELPARRARSSSLMRRRRLSEPAPLLPHSWREEKEVELSPLRFKASPKQEEEEEFSEQGQSTPTGQGLQGAGIDVDLQAGMFQKMPMPELAMELLGLLTINLVLQPGVVFADWKKWLWAVLMAKILARLWGYLVSPMLLQTARRRHSAALLIEQTMTPGHYTHRRRLILWLRKTLAKEASHLLLWLASTMWVWMVALAVMQPEARQMFKAKFNWAPLAMMLHRF